MPQNLQADIDWHMARIAFYTQALEALSATPDTPDVVERREGLQVIIADLKRTLADLRKALGRLG
jgi:hypothetical protein